MGIEQIHIFTLESSKYDFEKRKTYKVFCGSEQGGSCITAKYIEKAYDFNFIYVNSKPENVINRLKDGSIDLAFKVTAAPATYFKDATDLKFVDLPTNFIMEDMYSHSVLKRKDYPWIDEDIHAYAVPKVLVTNLHDKKYDPIIENLTKILILNKRYLAKEYGKYWNDIDFLNMKFKKMSRPARDVILGLKK